MFGINQQHNNQMNKSEYRKIQFTGGSTYTVSLPKKWVVDNNLSSSDMVNITHLNDGNLQISPYESNSIKTVIELKIKNDFDTSLYVSLIGAYVGGADVIKITSKTPISKKNCRIIREFLRESRGLEISGDYDKEIYIISLLKQNEIPLKTSLNRMYALVTQIIEDALAVFDGEDDDLLSDIDDRERQIDARRLLVARQVAMALQSPSIGKALGLDNYQGMEHVSMARAFERMGDHANSFANLILNHRVTKAQIRISSSDVEVPRRHLTTWKNALKKLIYNTNLKNIDSIIEAKSELHSAIQEIEKSEEIFFERKNLQNIAAFKFSEKTRRLCAYSIDLADTLINIIVTSRMTVFKEEHKLIDV